MATSFLSKMAKVGLADHLRIIQDNERNLAHQAAVKKVLDQQHLQITESQMKKLTGGSPETNGEAPGLEPDDMGSINIDSPITNYYGSPPAQPATQPPPPPPAPTPATPTITSPTLLSKLLPYVATAALAAGSTGLGMYLGQSKAPAAVGTPPAQVTNTSSASGFNLDLGDPKK